ncbi:MAG: HPP family protein [Proteobacteria bacterium]|nr:MAG: HPP family protein [Pseudomonadota bacterium]
MQPLNHRQLNLAYRWMGIEIDPVSPKEKAISMIGGFLSIFLIMMIGQSLPASSGVPLIMASTAASAVLLFAVPHGQLSQPWPVLAGHVISAMIGVTCAKVIPNQAMAGGFAVGLAIFAMHQFKCVHPPGGATALTAVIGGANIHKLGYYFVLFPVLASAVIVVL